MTGNTPYIGDYTVTVTPMTFNGLTYCFNGKSFTYNVYIREAGTSVDCKTLTVRAPDAPSGVEYTVGNSHSSAIWGPFIVDPSECDYTI